MNRYLWAVFHWPQYLSGNRFRHRKSGDVIELTDVFVVPFCGRPMGWGYKYRSQLGVSEFAISSGLASEYEYLGL